MKKKVAREFLEQSLSSVNTRLTTMTISTHRTWSSRSPLSRSAVFCVPWQQSWLSQFWARLFFIQKGINVDAKMTGWLEVFFGDTACLQRSSRCGPRRGAHSHSHTPATLPQWTRPSRGRREGSKAPQQNNNKSCAACISCRQPRKSTW